MPAPPPKSPREGLSGPPLWTLTAVLVLVSGLLFYFAQAPLVQAFDALEPDPVEDAPPVEVVEEEPEEAVEPPPPPPEPWTRAEIDAGVAVAAAGVRTLVEEAQAELPTYEDLGSAEAAQAQRAAARFGRWGQVWRNRVDVYRGELPPLTLCVPSDAEPQAEDDESSETEAEPLPEEDVAGENGTEEDAAEEEPVEPLATAEACVEMHAILGDLEALAEARTYDGAEALLEAVVERRQDPRLAAYLGEPELSE